MIDFLNHKIIKPETVLFYCTRNAIRSPMAAALLQAYAGNEFYVDSAGVVAEDNIDGYVVAVMAEIDIDISDYVPKNFHDLQDNYFDLIITLSPESHHHALDLTRTMACDIVFWNTLDPSIYDDKREYLLQHYRLIRDQLQSKIENLFQQWQISS